MTAKSTIWTKDFIFLCLSYLFLGIAFYSLIPVLPDFITNEIKANKTYVGIIMSMYTISALAIRPFTGMALDSWGRKYIYLISFLFFALMFGGYVIATTVVSLAIVRFLHGLAWGTTSTSSSTIAVDLIPKEKRGEGIGYYGLTTTLGMALGPFIGETIYEKYSHDVLFISVGIVCLVGFLLAQLIRYPKFEKKQSSKFNWSGLISKKAIPVSICMFILMITYGALVVYVVLFGKEIGIAKAGSFFFVFSVGIVISRIVSGKVFDKFGPSLIIAVGVSLLILGFLILALSQNITTYLISAILLGLAIGIVMPIFQAMANNLVDPHQRGAANSTLFTALDLGITAGTILFGILSDKIKMSGAYLVCSVISLFGLLLFFTFVIKHYNKNKLI